MQTTPYLTGRFLVAMPGIGDPRFERSVIAMCSHDDGGALGIGIGAVYDGLSFHDVLRQLEIDPGTTPDVPMHVGGPVELGIGVVAVAAIAADQAAQVPAPVGRGLLGRLGEAPGAHQGLAGRQMRTPPKPRNRSATS